MAYNQEINPNQQQQLPGYESEMEPHPIETDPNYSGSGKLRDKVAIITGGDSGIGKAVAIAFAKEGANIVVSYLCEDQDAENARYEIEQAGKQCLLIRGDISYADHCRKIVEESIKRFGKLDILVNHAGEQYQTNTLDDITEESLQRIFSVNVFSMFYLTQAAIKHMRHGAAIINTVSIVAYKGNPQLIDYSATKGATLTFTRSLAALLAKDGIRVNAVAPGPIWTPLIPASFSPEKLKSFGKNTLLKRYGQPYELAAAYVYLANNQDSSYVTGQVVHVNGGILINS